MTETVEAPPAARTDVDELRSSAKGWHGVQLAVLGFIGLCGALQSGSAGSGPGWLQQLAAVLVLAALAVACVATVLVASEAWPVRARRSVGTGGTDSELLRGGRHLRTGIALTFLAVVLVALATSTSWWPRDNQGGGLVEVSTGQGTFCGRLTSSDGGSLALVVAGRSITLPVGQVAGLRPVASCGS